MSTPWRSMRRNERLAWAADHWRMAVPVLTTLAGILLMSFPLFTPSPAFPHLAMLSVLVWSLFQPQLMPAWVALPLGLVTDAALGLPLGINATLLPLLALVVGIGEQSVGRQEFSVEWGFAAIIILGYQSLSALLLAFVLGGEPGGPMLVQGVATIFAYPPAVGIAALLQRRWVSR